MDRVEPGFNILEKPVEAAVTKKLELGHECCVQISVPSSESDYETINFGKTTAEDRVKFV